MINELLFIFHASVVALSASIAVQWGKSGLTTVVALFALLANVLITKQIILCSLQVTATDVFTIGCGVGLNLLQEYHGFNAARRALFISFGCLIIFAVMVNIHLWYIPAPSDVQHIHFCAVFAHMPRIIIASLIAFLASQYIDCELYRWLQNNFKHFFIRNYGSLTVSQLIDTILFTYIGLFGIMDNLYHVIIVSYGIKLITIMIVIPLVWQIKKLLPFNLNKN